MTRKTTIKKEHVILLSAAHIGALHMRRMGIYSLEKVANVVIFDCRKILNRQPGDNATEEKFNTDIIEIETLNDFVDLLGKFDAKMVIDFIGISETSAIFRSVLKEKKIPLVLVERGAVPKPHLKSRIELKWRILMNRRKQRKLLSIKNKSPYFEAEIYKENPSNIQTKIKVEFKVNKKSIKMRKAAVSFVSGKKGLNKYTKNATHIIHAPSIDCLTFELAQQSTQSRPQSEIKKYIVFIDDDLINAQDWKTLGVTSPVDAVKHLESLNKLFKDIENFTNLPIVIAAHPGQNDIVLAKASFKNRKIVYGDTANLVLNSEIVLTFASAAISFAVLAKKPITFLTSDKLKLHPYYLLVQSMSLELQSKIANIDEELNMNSLNFVVNSKKYEKYQKNYIGSSTDIDPWVNLYEFVDKKYSSKRGQR